MSNWNSKAAGLLSVITVLSIIAAYISGVMSGYVSASDFKLHVQLADARYYQTVKTGLKKEIKVIENKLALYELDRDSRDLTPRERLDETQLKNLKAEYLRELN